MSKAGRVLIIEDVENLRNKFRKSVEKAGYDVDVAGTKLEALEKIKCRTYHVALIDVMLARVS